MLHKCFHRFHPDLGLAQKKQKGVACAPSGRIENVMSPKTVARTVSLNVRRHKHLAICALLAEEFTVCVYSEKIVASTSMPFTKGRFKNTIEVEILCL